jgi:hypothetical protein
MPLANSPTEFPATVLDSTVIRLPVKPRENPDTKCTPLTSDDDRT